MDQKLRILKLLEDGKITANKAQQLLGELDGENLSELINNISIEHLDIYNAADGQVIAKKKDGFNDVFFKKNIDNEEKMLYIKILSCDKDKVNINLPMCLAKVFLKGGDVWMERLREKLDINFIIESIENEAEGILIDIVSNDGDRVIVEID